MDDDISCDQCIELAEALIWQTVTDAIKETLEIANRLNDVGFKNGMESACEEILFRLDIKEGGE